MNLKIISVAVVLKGLFRCQIQFESIGDNWSRTNIGSIPYPAFQVLNTKQISFQKSFNLQRKLFKCIFLEGEQRIILSTP